MNETNRESQNRERERGRWRKTEESKEKQNEIEPGRGEVDESKVGGMRTVETKEKRDRMKGTTRDGRRKMTEKKEEKKREGERGGGSGKQTERARGRKSLL